MAGPTWSDLLKHWALVECDLQDIGIDLGDDELLIRRHWPWLRTRVLGLLSADTRLHRVLIPRGVPRVSAPG